MANGALKLLFKISLADLAYNKGKFSAAPATIRERMRLLQIRSYGQEPGQPFARFLHGGISDSSVTSVR